MIKYGKSYNTVNRKLRLSIFTAAILSASIFLAAALGSSSSSLQSLSQPYENPLFAFAQTQTQGNAALSLANLIKQGQPHQGSASAPVTLIDFSDLQCSLCDRFVKATEPQINSTYVQGDKVAFIFEHLPNRGFDSLPAALAAQCTNDQGKFWQYHNLLYKNQGPIDTGWASKDNLKKFASQIPGLDIQKFNSCFDSQKYKPIVANDLALAHSLGFTQTPSFIVVKSDGSNPQKVEGPQPFPEFKAVMDKELGAA
ncbi:MAG: thioredoxin domain-containing protein [Candidatus Nitrosopolaris sp.]